MRRWYGSLFKRRCDTDPDKPTPPAAMAVPPALPKSPVGPGDHLHDAILRWVGEAPTEDCQCRSRIAQMNAWGPQGCREHLDEIVEWLLTEAQRRGWGTAKLPGVHWAVKRLVLSAIHKAERAVGKSVPALSAASIPPTVEPAS